MQALTPVGQQLINDLAWRHGFGVDATLHMLEAVRQGNGSMAQFSHPEFSGSGQWMQGGMTMVSDMFNNHLKGRVDALCAELSRLLAQQGNQLWAPTPAGTGVSGSGGDWWPADLRWPNSTGAQNGVRYAHFAQARRLVIDVGGTVTVYDTLDHQISGFSQQQHNSGGTLSFSSQYGTLDVSSLPVLSSNGVPPPAAFSAAAPLPMALPPAPMPPTPGYLAEPPAQPRVSSDEVFGLIERLAELRAKGILSDDEFNTKKTELLRRL